MSRRANIMLCYPFEEKRLKRWGVAEVIVQPKLDGERCRAIVTNGQVQLLSSEMNEILSVPHIVEELEYIFKDETIELDGELYQHDLDLPTIHSIVSRKENLHPEYSKMEYHLFDVVSLSTCQRDRLYTLLAIGDYFQKVKAVPTKAVLADVERILGEMNSYIGQGYEGIIVRHPTATYVRKRSPFMMKFKPKREDIYEILGYKQLKDKNGDTREELGSFICSSNEGTVFSVGSGLTQLQREAFWSVRDLIPGNYLRVQYQHTDKGEPRFPIFLEVISLEDIKKLR